MPQPLAELVDPSWLPALAPHEATLTRIGEFLRAEAAAGRPWAPAGANILRAFRQPLTDVRVLIVGQDPYPTPGHAVGLSFSVAPDVRPIPRSLQNIYRELVDDCGCAMPRNGDLSPWTERGVMLLNRVLTVGLGSPGSHRGIGWEDITAAAIAALAARGGPLVAILWGRDAQSLRPALGDVPAIESVHPSPMSADRGFFGSHPFTRANAYLQAAGAPPVDWSLGAAGIAPDVGPFFHGTKADLQAGDLLTAGFQSNYKPEIRMNHIYFTALRDGAGLAAEVAPGDAEPRVYVVEPTGSFENDPNVTDKKFPGNPTRSYRSTEPLRIVGEVTDWTRLTPDELQTWRDRLAAIRADDRAEIIN